MGAGRRFARVTCIALVIAACSPQPAPGEPPAPEATAAEQAIVDLTNAERGRSKLPRLRRNEALDRAARIQAQQMARAGRLDHEVRGARYPKLPDRLAAVGYAWQTIGENVAFNQPSAAAVLTDWMRSTGHRRNILNRVFTELGVGQAADSRGRPYYVQVFARPAP